jgi:hypothetical protein
MIIAITKIFHKFKIWLGLTIAISIHKLPFLKLY